MEGRRRRLEKVPRSRVVLGRLCTGKRKLLDSFEQASKIKCSKLVTEYQNCSEAESTGPPSVTESDSDNAEGEDEASAGSAVYSSFSTSSSLSINGDSEDTATKSSDTVMSQSDACSETFGHRRADQWTQTDDTGESKSKKHANAIRLLEKAASVFEDQNMLERIWQFLKLVSDKRFPLDNIVFQLFLDVVGFYGTENLCGLRCSNKDTLNFWVMGYLLLHGKFFRFMRGLKSCGSVTSGAANWGNFSPILGSINFAVPAESVITKCIEKVNNIARFLRPGINFDLIDNFIKNEELKKHGGNKKQYVLSFDGKLIRPGFTKDSGDIDMFGCEKQPTLSQRKCREDEELVHVNEVISSLSNLQPFAEVTALDFDFLAIFWSRLE